MTIYLSWCSSVTHQSALTFLRNYLHNNRSKVVWRIVSMLILLIFLGVTVGPTAHFDYVVHSDMDSITKFAAVPPWHFAICYFRGGIVKDNVAFQSMLIFWRYWYMGTLSAC